MDTRTAIWDARLIAKIATHYYRCKTTLYQRCDRWYSVLIAVCASATVAAWLRENASVAVPALGLLGVVVSVLPFRALFVKWVLEAELACKHWSRRELAWDVLWLEVETNLDAVTNERVAAELARDKDFHEPSSPRSPRLAAQCQIDIHRSLGLDLPTVST